MADAVGWALDAPAKINLFLTVTGRRSDGYHLLHSLVAFTQYGDRLKVTPGDGVTLEVSGPFAPSIPAGADNLVLRAAHLLQTHFDVPSGAHFFLEKNLPAASGIGGGSADAAAALRLLSRLWDIDVDTAGLAELALELGADVPVCLVGTPSLISGIGEQIVSAPPIPNCGIVLMNPGKPVSTPAVFAAREGEFSMRTDDKLPSGIDAFAEMLRQIGNDLTDAAISLEPAIAHTLEAIGSAPGCLFAGLSGSGATCFGLFRDLAASDQAGIRLGTDHDDCWVLSTEFRRDPAAIEEF